MEKNKVPLDEGGVRAGGMGWAEGGVEGGPRLAKIASHAINMVGSISPMYVI